MILIGPTRFQRLRLSLRMMKIMSHLRMLVRRKRVYLTGMQGAVKLRGPGASLVTRFSQSRVCRAHVHDFHELTSGK